MSTFRDLLAKLPPKQKALLQCLLAARQRENSVDNLYRAIGGAKGLLPRVRQMRVGALVSQLNPKMEPLGFVIRPGIARRTYRVYQLGME